MTDSIFCLLINDSENPKTNKLHVIYFRLAAISIAAAPARSGSDVVISVPSQSGLAGMGKSGSLFSWNLVLSLFTTGVSGLVVGKLEDI